MRLINHWGPRRLLVLASTVASVAGAQSSVGVGIGAVLDAPEARGVVGTDLRYVPRGTRLALNPRFAAYLSGSRIQARRVDLNLLYRLPGPDGALLEPNVGIGAAWVSGDLASPGVSDDPRGAGMNLLAGFTTRATRVRVFGEATYTIDRYQPNIFTALAGIRLSIGDPR